MDDFSLICPHCSRKVEIAEAILENIRGPYEREEKRKHSQEIEAIKRQLAEKNELERADLQQRLREEITGEQAKQLALEKANNEKLRAKIDNLLEKLNTETEARRDVDAEMQEKIMAVEVAAREAAQKNAAEQYQLELEQSNKKIADLQKQAVEMQRKATQVSGQLKGEALELSFESSLKAEFPHDLIEEVAKGVRGADVQQTVRTVQGVVCGIILWESKNAKQWKDDWIYKLKDDTSAVKAHIPAMVSVVLPEESPAGIVCYQGVWVAKPASVLILARLLRMRLLEIQQAAMRHTHRETNAEILYNYVTGHEFAQQVNAILKVFVDMKKGIDTERKVLEKSWAKREAEVNKLFKSTAYIVGSMEGAIGSDSMPKIEGLSLDNMLEFENKD